MTSTVQELVKDISAIDLERDRAAINNLHEQSTADIQEDCPPERSTQDQGKAIERAQTATDKRKRRPVLETYNCHDNKNKFCIPIGIESATNLELGFALDR